MRPADVLARFGNIEPYITLVANTVKVLLQITSIMETGRILLTLPAGRRTEGRRLVSISAKKIVLQAMLVGKQVWERSGMFVNVAIFLLSEDPEFGVCTFRV